MITKKQQELMMQMHDNHGIIKKKQQEVYKSIHFYSKMSHLQSIGLISSMKEQDNTMIYKLTEKGYAFLRMVSLI